MNSLKPWCECSYRIWRNTVLPMVEHHIKTIIRTLFFYFVFGIIKLTNTRILNMKTIFETLLCVIISFKYINPFIVAFQLYVFLNIIIAKHINHFIKTYGKIHSF